MVRFIENVNSVQINAGEKLVVVIGAEAARRANPKQHLHFGKPQHGKRPADSAPASRSYSRDISSSCRGTACRMSFAGMPAFDTAGTGGDTTARTRDRDVRAGGASQLPASPRVAANAVASPPAAIWAALVISRALSL